MLTARHACGNESAAVVQHMTAFLLCCRSSYPLLALDQLAPLSPLGPIASGLCRLSKTVLVFGKLLRQETVDITFCDLYDITEGSYEAAIRNTVASQL